MKVTNIAKVVKRAAEMAERGPVPIWRAVDETIRAAGMDSRMAKPIKLLLKDREQEILLWAEATLEADLPEYRGHELYVEGVRDE